MARNFGIDLRTLALFRICLGAVILADLINRERTLPDYQPPEYKVIRLLNWNCLPKGDE